MHHSRVGVWQGERLADLQHEYMRVSRVADLSAGLSRENIAKAGHLTQRLNQVTLIKHLPSPPRLSRLVSEDLASSVEFVCWDMG